MQKVLIIVGPTASGKSDLAVKLAQKFNGEVISADSRQVYKGLDIGTGKITKRERRGVPHHLLDVVSPKKRFTASDFKTLGEKALQDIVRRGKLPIIVGGTGFYIDALIGNNSLPQVPPNQVLRQKLEKKSAEQLFAMLKKKDLRRAKTIDPHNKVRLIRALEIIEAIGKVPPRTSPRSPLLDLGEGLGRGQLIWIGLKPEDLDTRIEKRVKKMFKAGLLKEVKKLKKAGLSNKRLKELGFEYWQPSVESVTKGSKLYAKRQMTWFKRNNKINWYESGSDAYTATIEGPARSR